MNKFPHDLFLWWSEWLVTSEWNSLTGLGGVAFSEEVGFEVSKAHVKPSCPLSSLLADQDVVLSYFFSLTPACCHALCHDNGLSL